MLECTYTEIQGSAVLSPPNCSKQDLWYLQIGKHHKHKGLENSGK